MYEIKILKNESEIDSLNTDDFMLIMQGDGGMAECYKDHLSMLSLDSKNVIFTKFTKTIRALCQKYNQYLSVPWPDNICCLVDSEWEPKESANKNTLWKVNIRRASKDMRLLTGYDYVLQMRQYWLDQWSEEQTLAAIMSQLLRINQEDGSILKYSEDFTSKLVSTFGEGYLDCQSEIQIPNILEEEVVLHGFKRADGQITMDEAQSEKDGGDDDEQ